MNIYDQNLAMPLRSAIVTLHLFERDYFNNFASNQRCYVITMSTFLEGWLKATRDSEVLYTNAHMDAPKKGMLEFEPHWIMLPTTILSHQQYVLPYVPQRQHQDISSSNNKIIWIGEHPKAQSSTQIILTLLHKKRESPVTRTTQGNTLTKNKTRRITNLI